MTNGYNGDLRKDEKGNPGVVEHQSQDCSYCLLCEKKRQIPGQVSGCASKDGVGLY